MVRAKSFYRRTYSGTIFAGKSRAEGRPESVKATGLARFIVELIFFVVRPAAMNVPNTLTILRIFLSCHSWVGIVGGAGNCASNGHGVVWGFLTKLVALGEFFLTAAATDPAGRISLRGPLGSNHYCGNAARPLLRTNY